MKVSIACLIYKSIAYLEFVKKSIEKYTPMLKSGEAEFYFVCNNATQEVKDYLKCQNIKHWIFETEKQPPYPENIGYIYKAWNFAVEKAEGEIVVLINSDMAFSPDWLENLIKCLDDKRVITSRLVESGKLLSTLPHTIVKDFGRNVKDFKEEDFQIFAKKNKQNDNFNGGTFMAMAIFKSVFIKAGGYPEGNIDGISGDAIFFNQRLREMGVNHHTAFDSIVYHIQTGESSE